MHYRISLENCYVVLDKGNASAVVCDVTDWRCSVGVREVQPVGLAEIASRLGVRVQTANMWRHRKLLPEPGEGTVSGAPWWDWAEIETWSRETGHPRPSSR